MKKYIQKAYEKCIYIFNNGFEYEFYTRFDRRPTKIVLALDGETLSFCLENNKKYMDRNDLDELKKLIEIDKKPWGYAELPTKEEQIQILKANKKIADKQYTQVILPLSTYEQVTKKCKEMGITYNECVNQLLNVWIKE